MPADPARLAFELRAERDRQGLSQAQLARMAGSYQAVISKVEQGRHELQLDLLCRICEALLGPNGLGILLYRSGHIHLDLPLREMIGSAPGLSPESRAMLVRGYDQALAFDCEGGYVIPPGASPE